MAEVEDVSDDLRSPARRVLGGIRAGMGQAELTLRVTESLKAISMNALGLACKLLEEDVRQAKFRGDDRRASPMVRKFRELLVLNAGSPP